MNRNFIKRIVASVLSVVMIMGNSIPVLAETSTMQVTASPESAYIVTVPAALELHEVSTHNFSGDATVGVKIKTLDPNYHVYVNPDPTVTLTGVTDSQTFSLNTNIDKNDFTKVDSGMTLGADQYYTGSTNLNVAGVIDYPDGYLGNLTVTISTNGIENNETGTPVELNDTDTVLEQLGYTVDRTIYEHEGSESYTTALSIKKDGVDITSIDIPKTYEYAGNIYRITCIGAEAFHSCQSLSSITIPDSVTSIGFGAFAGCQSLSSITIPDSVTSIGEWAFESCTSLTSINIPDSVTSIGTATFYCCESLSSIVIPDSVTSIGIGAFYYCESLSSIAIPNSVTSIGASTFYGCTGLTSITIPDSVTRIGEDAFCLCSSLTSINYSGTKAQWSSITKGNDWNDSVPSTCVIHCTDEDLDLDGNAI